MGTKRKTPSHLKRLEFIANNPQFKTKWKHHRENDCRLFYASHLHSQQCNLTSHATMNDRFLGMGSEIENENVQSAKLTSDGAVRILEIGQGRYFR